MSWYDFLIDTIERNLGSCDRIKITEWSRVEFDKYLNKREVELSDKSFVTMPVGSMFWFVDTNVREKAPHTYWIICNNECITVRHPLAEPVVVYSVEGGSRVSGVEYVGLDITLSIGSKLLKRNRIADVAALLATTESGRPCLKIDTYKLCKLSGVSMATINKWIREGADRLSYPSRAKIANALGIPADELI